MYTRAQAMQEKVLWSVHLPPPHPLNVSDPPFLKKLKLRIAIKRVAKLLPPSFKREFLNGPDFFLKKQVGFSYKRTLFFVLSREHRVLTYSEGTQLDLIQRRLDGK